MRTQAWLITIAVAGLLAGGRAAAQPLPDSTRAIWSVRGEGRGTPVHDQDTVYFLTRTREVLALNRGTGRERWRTATGVTSVDGIYGDTTAGTALAIAGDVVVAGDWDVVGFDRRSGRRLWTYASPTGDGPGLFLGPAVDGVVYGGSARGRTIAIDTATGKPRWLTTVIDGPATVFEPIVEGEAVLVGFTLHEGATRGGVARLDARSGRVLWITWFPRTGPEYQPLDRTGGPIVVDDVVYASVHDGNIYAFDLRSGALRWTLPRLTGPLDGIVTDTESDARALVRVGRLLVAGSATGTVVAYDLDTRQERWRYAGGQWGSTAFVLGADATRVFLPFLGGFIVTLDAATGTPIWRFGDFRLGCLWPPDPADDVVYVAGSLGGYYAVAPSPKEPQP